jgi:hypothetical protein
LRIRYKIPFIFSILLVATLFTNMQFWQDLNHE